MVRVGGFANNGPGRRWLLQWCHRCGVSGVIVVVSVVVFVILVTASSKPLVKLSFLTKPCFIDKTVSYPDS